MTGNLHLIRRAISVSWTHSDRMPSWSGPGPPSRRIIQSISIDPPNRWAPHWTHCTTSMNRHCEIRECSRNYKQTCSHWLHFAKLHLKKVTFCKKSASHWPQESMFKHVGNHLIFIKSLKNEKQSNCTLWTISKIDKWTLKKSGSSSNRECTVRSNQAITQKVLSFKIKLTFSLPFTVIYITWYFSSVIESDVVVELVHWNHQPHDYAHKHHQADGGNGRTSWSVRCDVRQHSGGTLYI